MANIHKVLTSIGQRFFELLISVCLMFFLFPGTTNAHESSGQVGVWNGYLAQTNVLECVNGGERTVYVELTVRNNSTLTLGNTTFAIPAHGTKHFILNAFDINNQYGTVLIQASDDEVIRCSTSFYRFNAEGSLDYAFSIPAGESLTGTTIGVFNSMNPTGEPTPAYNWLSLYNPGQEPLTAKIRLYNQEGVMMRELEAASLLSGERRDYALGHNEGQVVGIYEIVPENDSIPYGAFLARYQPAAGNKFSFAFVLFPQEPSEDTGSMPISTMDPATNWIEIANPSSEEALVHLELRDQIGSLVYDELFTIAGYGQKHVYVNQYLGDRRTGSLRARSFNGQGVLVQSMFYGHPSDGTNRVAWAYGSQQLKAFSAGDTALTAVNTYLGAANWVKEFNLAELKLYTEDGSELSEPVRTPGLDLGLHAALGNNFLGLLAAKAEDGYASETLRVYPGAEGIKTIMKIGASRIHFSGGPSSNEPLIPLGIPAPDFGISEQAPVYDQNNSLHYYVQGPTNCSNSNNGGRGSPQAPLCSIPRTLSAGAYVEVHGGPYDAGPHLPSWSGTAQNPIFIKGVGLPRFNKAFNIYNDAGGGGAYAVIEGLSFFSVLIGNSYHHVSIRRCDVHGDLNAGGLTIHANAKQVGPVHHIVIYHNEIHDNGIWDPRVAQGDRDIHGLSMGWYSKVEYAWVLDNRIYHNEGDAIQLEAGPNASPADVNHIYIGRNIMHHNKQSGVALKHATDVIVSQNNIFGHRRSSSAMGPGIGFSDNGPRTAWFIFNRIHDNEIGIKMNGGNGAGPYYIIGNLIYNIHAFTDGTYSPNDAWHYGQAVVDWHRAKKYFLNNTVYDTDGGYGYAVSNYTEPQNLTIANNIFFGLSAVSHALNVEDSRTAQGVIVSNNLFAPLLSLRWGSGKIYTSLSTFVTATGKCSGCLQADPLFADAPSGDFHLQSGSPAQNGGAAELADELAATFFASYGVDIRKDLDAVPRPQELQWDIGAYEIH